MRLAKIQRQTEYKDWGPKGSIKADGVQGTISGYLGHFHNVDSQLDVILPGAFTQKGCESETGGPAARLAFPSVMESRFFDTPRRRNSRCLGRCKRIDDPGKPEPRHSDGQGNV